jgi:cytochrome c
MVRPNTILVLAIGLSSAAPARGAEVKADLEYGQYLASECVTCHSATGGDKGIPSIIGWDEKSFVSIINAYKSKELENPAMRLIAGRLDDEQIASLALYFGSLEKAR